VNSKSTFDQSAMSAQIRINVNGTVQTLPRMTLAEWVDSTGVLPSALATAINGQFVSRAARAGCLLKDGDVLTTFQPIAGG